MTDYDKQNTDRPESDRPELDEPLNTAIESDATVEAEAESAAAASDTFEQASDDLLADRSETDEDEAEEPEPAGKTERLQKILAKSGIASRRHAEELITQGRVQVNGKVVTELGSKADPDRDHIRVDGKLLQGSERHRYFILNKPKGYVTTVSDPEGRPTIMEFFSKTRERLYPVGRLDYLSEGLLLVTNDGELANKLTRAASGVEKTYLVKVSGQPSEEDIERLREGVGIQKGKAGSGRVQTAPAQIRLFRPAKSGGQRGPARSAENPWYEVVLIEGRNRELRKMFEEIGHHVEKIRRVGYGPLVLDLEPGKVRELEGEEVENLRKAAEGKYRKPKTREPRKREFGQRSERGPQKARFNERREGQRTGDQGRSGDRGSFGANQRGTGQGRGLGRESGREFGDRRPERKQFGGESRGGFGRGTRPNPRFGADRSQRPPRRDEREQRPIAGSRENRSRFAENRSFQREDRPKRFDSRPPRFGEAKPARGGDRDRFQRPDRGAERSAGRPSGGFGPKRTDERGPQRFGGKRADEGFTPRKKLNIEPVNEEAGQRQDRAPSFPERRPERRSPNPRFERPRGEGRGPQGRESHPPRRDREDRPRFDRPRSEGAGRREMRPSREGHPEREDRPRREAGPRREERPRREGGFSGSRPGGFKGGKPGARGGKPGSVRSGGGQRSGPQGGSRPNARTGSRPSNPRSGSRPPSRSGGNRGGKRRP